MSEKTQNESPMQAIIHNYIETEKSLVTQLNFQANHSLTIGGFREEIWKQLFQQIIPKKYVIEQSVFLMDSNGKVSNEVDLAIFDEMYTPYIFRNGRIKFIPIEAVAAVIQCKSTNVNSKKTDKYDLEEWCQSINDLNTSGDSVTRVISELKQGPAKSQSGTRPIKILCALEKPPKSIIKNDSNFDFYVIADMEEKSTNKIESVDKNKSNYKIKIIIPHEDDWDLGDWHEELNMRGNIKTGFEKKILNRTLSEYKITYQDQPVSLLSLNLQLNQLLMLINNPMLFPHNAYAKMFNSIGGEDNKNGTDKNRRA